MSEGLRCTACGAVIPSGTPTGQCPKCLFGLGVAAAVEPAPARTPRCFAGYELVRQIDHGAMGVVYEARQPRLNRTVALKMILGGESCSPVVRRRFLIEAEAAARLDHPNIVPIYEVGEFEDQPFLSMKLVQGESLRKKMMRGELSLPKDGEHMGRSAMAERERTIARLIATLARAVHHAHTHNVVHRDLKPGNILFDANNTPYVSDFGLAKILDPDHSDPSVRTEVIGTLSYMSPQQVRAEAITPATDIYSLGVVLYELLARQAPFQGATPNETLRLIETEPPTRLRHRNQHIHKDLETICLKCLEKDTGNRYPTAEALAEDLERWLANQPIRARPAGPFLRLGHWVKRNPVGAALIFCLTLTLFVSLVACVELAERNQIQGENAGATLRRWTKEINGLWDDPSRTNLLISADDIASYRRRHVPNVTNSTRLTIEFNIDEEPIVQMESYAPLLEHLQNTMGAPSPPTGLARWVSWTTSWLSRRPAWQLTQPVILDLKFCKTNSLAFHEIASGRADFQRLGAVSYLQARELDSGVQAVVQEDAGKRAVIFVRQDSSITNLGQFADHSFAFPDTNSTIGVWAKVHLVNAGVYGTNQPGRAGSLRHYETFPEAPLDGMRTGVSGTEAARRVLNGEFDGAVLQERYFDQLKHNGPYLRQVFSFSITPNVYVARSGLDTNVVRAFREAMLSIKDPDLLGALPPKPPVQRFRLPNEEEFKELSAAMSNEVLEFEGTRLAPPPAVRENQEPAP